MTKFIISLWNRLRGHKRREVPPSPSCDLPCKWCEEVKPTEEVLVWNGPCPEGWVVRLCKGCQESCAGG